MSVKKSRGKGKTAKKASAKFAKATTKRASSSKKKAVDIIKVREKISDLVGESAKDIANEVIKVAKTGQLASAKYLFEVVGLYPPTEETAVRPKEDTLAHTLLKRMGLPTEPVTGDEDESPVALVMKVTQEADDANGVEESGGEVKEPAAAEGEDQKVRETNAVE